MNDDDELDDWEDTKTLEERIGSGPLPRIFLWTALVAGAVWVVLNAIVQIRTAWGYANLFSSEGAATLWVWIQVASGIAYSVFLVALGSYILVWLRVRETSD